MYFDAFRITFKNWMSSTNWSDTIAVTLGRLNKEIFGASHKQTTQIEKNPVKNVTLIIVEQVPNPVYQETRGSFFPNLMIISRYLVVEKELRIKILSKIKFDLEVLQKLELVVKIGFLIF